MTQSSPFTRADTSKERADDLIVWLRDYAENHINSRLIDERRTIPPYIVLDFGNRGLLGLHVAPSDGGAGLNHRDTIRLVEQTGAIDAALTTFYSNHNFLGLRPIQKFATEPIKSEWLPRLATGRALASFALTEPASGSNPRALTTQALVNGQGHWLLRGSKSWIGSAAWADTVNVFARHPESGQISGFVVRRGTTGLQMGPEALTMGMRGMVQNSIHLQDVSVDETDLLGEQGQGMSIAQDAMMYTRMILAACCVGGMKRCAQLMLRYATRRTVATGNLLDNPVMLAKFSELTATITAVHALVSQMARLMDAGWTIPAEISAVAKITGSESYWHAADMLVQTLGGRGYVETNLAPQMLRDARVFRVLEGPTETLTMFLGANLVNGSEELYRFLNLGLDVPHITERLRTTIEEIRDYHSPTTQPTGQVSRQQQWLYTLIGEVAIYGTLLAALESLVETTESMDQALLWAELRFEHAVSSAYSSPLDAPRYLDRESITELVTSYTSSIGDIEQSLSDEDRELDELLRRPVAQNTNGAANDVSAMNGIAPMATAPAVANPAYGV